MRQEDVNDVMPKGSVWHWKGQAGRRVSKAMSTQSSAAPGAKKVWYLSDTAVEMQIHRGKPYTQKDHFLLFWVSRGEGIGGGISYACKSP